MALFKRKSKKVEPEGRDPERTPMDIEGVEGTPTPKLSTKTSEGEATRAVKGFWISEKATDLGKNNQYAFLVSTDANKSQTKKEIETRFKVTVTKVNTITHHGKPKRWGTKRGHQPRFKKAIVTLKKGNTIEAI
jgi:large subunit ribosomal protein L23